MASNSWMGKLSGLSPRNKGPREPSPPRRGRARDTVEVSPRASSANPSGGAARKSSSILRPRSMSPFAMIRRSRENILSDDVSESALGSEGSTMPPPALKGGRESSRFGGSAHSNASGASRVSYADLIDDAPQEFFDQPDSEEPHLPSNDGINNSTMRPLLEDMGNEGGVFTMEGQADLQYLDQLQQAHEPNMPPRRSLSNKRDGPLRASHLDVDGDAEGEHAYYHYSQQHSLGESSPPHSGRMHEYNSGKNGSRGYGEEEAEEDFAGDEIVTGEPQSNPEVSRMASFLERPSHRSPSEQPHSTSSEAPTRGRTSNSQRGSTPRGSSLDGSHKKPPQAADSPSRALTEKSSYVRHLETELATLRADRSSLMQTILDLKQENEEHAQAAAMVDDDNDGVRESLSGRINELNSALRKANASIKLMRQANHTLKVELDEVRGENQTMRDQLLRAKLENSQLAAQLNSPPLSPENKSRRAPPPPRSPRSSEAGEASRVSSNSQHRSSKSQQRALASHPPPPGPPLPPPPHPPRETSGSAADAGEEQPNISDVDRSSQPTEKRRSRSKSANRGAMSPPPMPPPPPPPPSAPKHHDYGSQDGNSSVDILSNSNAFAAPSKRSTESSRRGPSPLSRSSRPKDGEAPASPMSPGPRVRSSLRPSSRTPRGSEAELADVTPADSDSAPQPEVARGRDQRRPSGAPRPPSPVSARKRPSSKDPSSSSTASSPRASRMLQSSLGSPGGVASALSPGPRRSRAQPSDSNKGGASSEDMLAHQPSSPSNQPPSVRPSSRSSTHSQSARGQSAEPATSSSKEKTTPESLPRRVSSASPRSKPPSALTSELLRTSPLFRPASPLSSIGNKDDGSLGSEHFASEDTRTSLSSATRGKSQSTTSPRNGVPPPSKLQQRQVNMRKSTPSFSTTDLEASTEPSRATRSRASINTFSNTELSEHGRGDERIGRGRRSAGNFNFKDLEEQPIVPRVSQFLESGERTGRPAAATAPSSSITSAFSSASPAKKDKAASAASSSPRLSSSAARSSSSTRASAHLVSNTPRFKETPSADSEAEAAAKRAAYKEQCEREILEFQKNLAMEDGGAGEDLAYLAAGSRQKVIRRSASLEREALMKKNGGL